MVATVADSSPGPIRVVLVDDHEMLLQGVAMALGRQPDIDVLATAASWQVGFDRFCALEPDVLVVDYLIDAENGADLARTVIHRNPGAAVVAMSAIDAPYVLDDVMDAGCVGFVDKRLGVDELATAVRAASAGSIHFPRRVITGPRGSGNHDGRHLTRRELEVLERLGRGHHTSDIARELDVSVHTVRNHVREIRSKLDAPTQLAAVLEGIRLGLIPSPGHH